MRVLVLCGDYWHSAEVIRRGLAAMRGDEFSLDFVEAAKDILTPALMAEYPVIVNCKCDEITAANRHPWFDEGVSEVMPGDLRAYVERGGGFLAVHSGNAYFPESTPAYVDFVGNYFVQHPPRCDMEIDITARHPITDGVSNFTVRDEHYEIAVVADDAQELFRTKSATGGNQVGGYTRQIGKGRLCVMTPGHIMGVWAHPSYQRLLGNAIRWCAGQL